MNAQSVLPAGDTGAIAVLSWAWAAVAVTPPSSPVAWPAGSRQAPVPDLSDVRYPVACAS